MPRNPVRGQLALAFDQADPRAAYEADPSALIVSVSGGLDSTALALEARRRWPTLPIILWHAWLEGHDWPHTWEQIGRLQRHIGNARRVAAQVVYELDGSITPSGCNGTHLRRIHTVADDDLWFGPALDDDPAAITTLLDLSIKARKGQPPTKRLRYCTDYFKGRCCDRWINEHLAALGPRPILLTGERWAESDNRAHLPEWQWRFERQRNDVLWLRPIIALRAHEVARRVIAADPALVHPGYFIQGETLDTLTHPAREERGRARLSCVACVFTNQGDLATALHNAPEIVQPHVARIQRYERESGYTWQQRGALLPTHANPSRIEEDR
jgi:3'-phosphoadenosine 5'-phosphosulfate sulfotransferase (PAPS reductase)/FAD synthetase